MHQLRNREVNEKHFLITLTCFSLKSSIFNKWNNCIFMSDVILLYSFLPSSPHTLCTTVDHKSLSVCRVDYQGQKSGHLHYEDVWVTAQKLEHTHTNKTRKLTSYFTIFKSVCIFCPSWEMKCHEKLTKHYISETRTAFICWLFSWVWQAMLVSASDPQMWNQTKKKSKALRLG